MYQVEKRKDGYSEIWGEQGIIATCYDPADAARIARALNLCAEGGPVAAMKDAATTFLAYGSVATAQGLRAALAAFRKATP